MIRCSYVCACMEASERENKRESGARRSPAPAAARAQPDRAASPPAGAHRLVHCRRHSRVKLRITRHILLIDICFYYFLTCSLGDSRNSDTLIILGSTTCAIN